MIYSVLCDNEREYLVESKNLLDAFTYVQDVLKEAVAGIALTNISGCYKVEYKDAT